MSKTKFILGLYDDEEVTLKAIKVIREDGVEIHDVYCPFPVHGMEDALGIPYTRIPRAAFLIGATFCLTAFLTMWWMLEGSYPINFGGKPLNPFPSFIPPTFEATVLTTAVGMAIIYMTANSLIPSPKQHPVDLRATNDRFVMAIEINDSLDLEKVNKLLNETGAVEVKEKEIELDKSLKKATA